MVGLGGAGGQKIECGFAMVPHRLRLLLFVNTNIFGGLSCLQ